MISVGKTIVKVTCGAPGHLSEERMKILTERIDHAIASADRTARMQEREKFTRLTTALLNDIGGLSA